MPVFEIRAHAWAAGDLEIEVWQLPSTATPHLTVARRLAGLRGRNLGLVEHRLFRQLAQDGIDVRKLRPADTLRRRVPEDDALRFGLMFRALAPMRKRGHIGAVLRGIEAMGKEEAAYWLGMAMHRKYPRRVLMALRFLLIDPRDDR